MRYPKFKYFYAFFDFWTIILSIVEARKIVSIYNQAYFKTTLTSNIYLSFVFFNIAILFILIFQNNNLYKQNVFLSRSKQLTEIIRSLFLGVVLLVFISFLIKLPLIKDARLFVFLFAIIAFINFIFIRIFFLRKIYLYLKNDNILSRNVVIWGAGKAGKLLATKLLFEISYGIKVIGFIDDYKNFGEEVISGLKVLGNQEILNDFNFNKNLDEIIISIDNIDYNRLNEILNRCNKIEVSVKLSSELFKIIPQNIVTEVYAGIPVIDLSPRFDKNINYVFKRLVDIIGSIVGLVILSPFFLIISILIKISSKGPIFYMDKRIGKNGRPFLFFKFRSMTIGNDDDKIRQQSMIEFIKNGKKQNENDTKIINHSRVTPIGKFIRKTSIDELPQLINVLKGEMSLVGPRPCLPYEFEHYDEWQKKRVSVIPGCTGVWQVSGRSNVSFNDSVVFDIYYINNMSPWLDLQLILKTIPVMVFGRGGK